MFDDSDKKLARKLFIVLGMWFGFSALAIATVLGLYWFIIRHAIRGILPH